MRAIAVLVLTLSAGAAQAGALSSGAASAQGVFVCTDDATATFAVAFTGEGCSIDGVSGQSERRGGASVCVTAGSEPEVFTLNHRDTFSLLNTATRGVLDGHCSRS